jgi:hypothetical protein
MDAPYRTDSWLYMESVSLLCRIQDRAGQAEVYFTAGSRCDKESCTIIVRRRQSLQFEWVLDEGDHCPRSLQPNTAAWTQRGAVKPPADWKYRHAYRLVTNRCELLGGFRSLDVAYSLRKGMNM